MGSIFGVIFIAISAWLIVRSNRRTRKSALVSIEKPAIVVLQLGNRSQAEMDADRAVYSEFYQNVSAEALPTVESLVAAIKASSCDILHLFVELDDRGCICDASERRPLTELLGVITGTSAKLVVFARSNPADGYMSGGPLPRDLNMIMCLDRKGVSFPRFLHELFSLVGSGHPLPIAWHKVAPQIPGQVHPDMPDLVASLGSKLVFLSDR